MTTQLYHLIPEPAGDWQEGDRQMWSSPINQYRARPVKAQAGQLWRDKIIQEFADYLPIRLGGLPDSDIAEVTKIAAEVLADVLAVSAQACACEASGGKKYSYCAKHDTYPANDEPCWQCLNPLLAEAEADRDQWRNTAKGWETEVKMWAARCARAANGRGSSGLR